jgi:phage terminase small subunit
MDDLTAKFVDEYLIDLNSTQAAIRAGYSKGTADKQGPRLLANPDVKAAIDAAKVKRSEQTGVNADWIFRRLVDEAKADLADLFHPGTYYLKPIEQWPEIWRSGLVQGVEIEGLFEGRGDDRIQIGQVKRIKLSDRVRRLELIGKHIRVNAFQETVRHADLNGLSERLERARQRLIESDVEAGIQLGPTGQHGT